MSHCVPLCPLVVKAGWDAMRVFRNGDHHGLEITKCAHCCIEELVWNVLRVSKKTERGRVFGAVGKVHGQVWRRGTCPESDRDSPVAY